MKLYTIRLVIVQRRVRRSKLIIALLLILLQGCGPYYRCPGTSRPIGFDKEGIPICLKSIKITPSKKGIEI